MCFLSGWWRICCKLLVVLLLLLLLQPSCFNDLPDGERMNNLPGLVSLSQDMQNTGCASENESERNPERAEIEEKKQATPPRMRETQEEWKERLVKMSVTEKNQVCQCALRLPRVDIYCGFLVVQLVACTAADMFAHRRLRSCHGPE